MTVVSLPDRAVLSVAGPEAEHFLQNILTVDLDGVAAGEAWPGALLSPQGKILFDFLVSRDGADGFLVDCRADAADDLVRRLTIYRLRAKVTIEKRDQWLVAASWDDDSTGTLDRRFKNAAVRRHYGEVPPATGERADWDRLRIASAVAETGPDYAPGEAFPHDVLLDQLGGIGFRKGCYVGQEVVSRMQHRGTARRRLLIAAGEAPLPASGAELSAGGRALGQLGTVVGREGLAIARLDRVKDALDAGLPIVAGGVPVGLSIPGWATFGFPSSAAGAAEEA